MEKINPTNALFIKLGIKGEWEKKCIKNSVLQIGFNEVNHKDLMNGRFEVINDYYKDKTSQRCITMYVNQLKNFYKTDDNTLWITFVDQKLYWCFADNRFEDEGSLNKIRYTKNGWSCENIYGKELIVDNLSGNLLKTQGFQSTICKVEAFEYLVKKINGDVLNEVLEVDNNFKSLVQSVSKLIVKLTPKDFEILTDLIFRQLGYQRTNVIGGPQKIKDIELISPASKERILVQVKCNSNFKLYSEYECYFNSLEGYDRFYYVVHTSDAKLNNYTPLNNKIFIWRLNEISEFIINTGLLNWVREKVN